MKIKGLFFLNLFGKHRVEYAFCNLCQIYSTQSVSHISLSYQDGFHSRGQPTNLSRGLSLKSNRPDMMSYIAEYPKIEPFRLSVVILRCE